MESDDITSFRNSHPTVVAAIDGCDRPDWALQLAFDAARDRKAVIAFGASSARALMGARLRSGFEIFIPWPGPLEAVRAWANDTSTRNLNRFRSLGCAAYLAAPVAFGIDRLTFSTGADWDVPRVVASQVSYLVSLFVLAKTIAVGIQWVVRRRASNLDEGTALQIVLRFLREGALRQPGTVPFVVLSLCRKLSALLRAEQTLPS